MIESPPANRRLAVWPRALQGMTLLMSKGPEDRTQDHTRRDPDVAIGFDHDAGAPRKARAAVRPLISTPGDPIALEVETVTSELVSNVIQHTDGGGTLKAWDPTPDVPLRLEVADQGNGEPEPVLQAEGAEVGGRRIRESVIRPI